MIKRPSGFSLFIVTVFFLSSTFIGFLRAPDFTGDDSVILGRPITNLRNTPYVHKQISLEDRHKKFWKFISHNSQSELIVILVGTLCFVIPAFRISLLGFIIGVYFWHIGSAQLFMRLMLPHSLIEIPLGLYCCAIAQSSGWKWLTAGHGKRWSCFKHEIVSNFKTWILVVLPAVVLSALLEAYVTNRF